MKKTLLTLVALLSFSVAFSQYYYITYDGEGKNPGNLNNDAEFPVGGGLPAGWSTLLSGPKAVAEWSANQTLPFAFNFNGLPVTSYRVSSTGVLTFDVLSPISAPSVSNAALPSANIPDNSICVWGIEAKAAGDNIITKTFGSAPNRQFWIQFSSFSEPNLGDNGWAYWSIVLEETSNKIYVVDQRNNCVQGQTVCTNKTALTVGIQIDGSTAIQVASSPNVQNLSGNSETPGDNAYYAFTPGTQPNYDLSVRKLTIPSTVKINTDHSVTGVIKNLGSEAVTSFDLYYTIDNGTPVMGTINGVNIASNGGEYAFTHPVKFNESMGGTSITIDVWAENINAGNVDEVPANDAISMDVFLNLGVNAPKTVLLEEGTGAWCIHCPDAHTYLADIIKSNPNKVVPALHHNSDLMTNSQSDLINSAFATGYPNGYIDRTFFEGATKVGVSRGAWSQLVTATLNKEVPVKVQIINKTWDESTRKISFDVEVEFVDYFDGNELRIGAMIIENNIRGVGTGYDQLIASGYVNDPGHVYFGKKTTMVGYHHPMVVINIPSGAWGSANSVTGSIQPGAKYTKSYSYTLPAEVKVTIPESAEFKPTGEVRGRNKANDIVLVGFVAEYNADVNQRPVLNSASTKLTSDFFTSMEEVKEETFNSSAFPNPVKNIGGVNFSLSETKNVKVSIYNTMGQEVQLVKQGDFAEGDHSIYYDASQLADGVYIIKISGDNINADHKIVVAK